MLRRFAGPRRRQDEDYVAWVTRATRIAEENARRSNVQSWVHQHLDAKWRWAGHVARMKDRCPDNWAYKSTTWRDAAYRADNAPGSEAYSLRTLRARPGRFLRWEQDIEKFAEHAGLNNWADAAKDKTKWFDLGSEFVEWAKI